MLHIGSTLNYNIIKSFQSRDWFSSYISDFSSIKFNMFKNKNIFKKRKNLHELHPTHNQKKPSECR